MIKNFFKVTFRNFWKNKTYSFLNIAGLAIGIACAGLIFLWMEDEMTYDTGYVKKDRLYKVVENQTYEGKTRTFNSTPGLLGPAIKAEIPGIANTCRANFREMLFTVGEKGVYEKGGYIDSSFFSMFQPQFIEGDAGNVFNQLYAVVISEKMAKRFFPGEGKVIGKTMRADNKQDYLVSGVIKDMPENSTLQIDWITSFDIYFKQNEERLSRWGSNSINTFVELSPATDPAAVNTKLYDFISKKAEGATAKAWLFAMNDWRLRANFEDGKIAGGRIQYVRMFSVIAWIILLIACINFMNLATARSEKRAREVGVRKVLGAGKGKLVFQFITEAIVLSALAVIVGLLIVLLVLPAFNQLVEKKLTIGLDQPSHIGFLLAITLICGLVAGSYPSLYLSSFNPIHVFKRLTQKSGGAVWIRKGLVVLQFTISIILIIGTIIIYNQIQHVKNRELGYNKDHLLSMPVRGNMEKNFSMIKQDLINTGVIENAALNSYNTFYIGNNSSSFVWEGKDPTKDILISYRNVSPEFVSTMGISMAQGRDFKGVPATDSFDILVTQSMEKLMGKGSAVGKTIWENGDSLKYTIVGVVKDYVYGDMYGTPDPIIFFYQPGDARNMYVRAKSGANIEDVIAKMGAVMKKNNPAYPFDYSFVDAQFEQLFKSETLISKLSRLFAVLAIVISCLGLFGLAAYTAERRVKEIGIRKVLGASVTGITRLLSRDFLRLVYISAIIAFPVAWWMMDNWLQDYKYRIKISWWVFVAAGILAVLIALITVSFQAIKAAIANPVKSLRNE